MTRSKLRWVAAAPIALAGCATNPVTGKRELALISEQQEIQIGKQAAQETAEQMGLSASQPAAARPRCAASLPQCGHRRARSCDRRFRRGAGRA